MLQNRYYNIIEKEQGKYLVQNRSHDKSSGIILPEVHGIDKGIDSNIRLEKQVIKPIKSSEAKGVSQVKPRLGQGRAGIKWKTFRFPMSQLFEKPEQKFLTCRRPIIHIAESPLCNILSLKQEQKFQYQKVPLQKVQNIMIRSFQYLITQFHKQCQSIIQFLEQ